MFLLGRWVGGWVGGWERLTWGPPIESMRRVSPIRTLSTSSQMFSLYWAVRRTRLLYGWVGGWVGGWVIELLIEK